MLLKRLRLRDVNQHEAFDYKFGPGVTGILGPNGSGKSNLVQALKATLTNNWNYKGRTKPEQIRRLSEDTHAFARATWDHGGTTFTITRSLRPSKSVLKIGDEKLSHNGRITERLRQLLNTSSRIIDEFVFVDQGTITDFFSARDTVRKSSFAHLCGIEEIEKLWDLLGERQRKDSSMVIEDLDGLDTLKARKKRLLARTVDLHDSLNQFRADVLEGDSRKNCQTTVDLYSRRKRLEERKETLETQHTGLTARQEELITKQDSVSAKVDELSRTLDESEGNYSEAKRAVADQKKIKRQRDRRRMLKDRIAEKPKPKPTWWVEGVEYRKSSEVQAALTKVIDELDAAKEVVSKLVKGDPVECPTCGTPVTDCREHIELAQQTVEIHPQYIEELQPELEAARKYEQQLAVWERVELQRKSAVKAAKEELATIKIPKLPSVEEADDIIRNYDKLEEQLEELEEKQRGLATKVAEASGSLKTTRKELDAVRAGLARSNVTKAAYDRARESIKKHDAAKVRIESLEEQLVTAKGELEEAKAELQRVRELKSRTKIARGWLRDLEKWREVVHRDNFPKAYMRSVLEDLVDRVNKRLHDFDGPFRVSAGSDVSFTVHNADGTTEDASGKSGGELAVLSICFRLAVNSRFAQDLGIMVLDEPTDGLDDHNMGCLASVLQRICEVTRRRGQQIIMITHDQRLARVFDHVIRLE